MGDRRKTTIVSPFAQALRRIDRISAVLLVKHSFVADVRLCILDCAETRSDLHGRAEKEGLDRSYYIRTYFYRRRVYFKGIRSDLQVMISFPQELFGANIPGLGPNLSSSSFFLLLLHKQSGIRSYSFPSFTWSPSK